MAEHDHAYKLLFSHPEMVRDLLESFVQQEWLNELDYDSLEKVPSSYVSDDLRERRDDVRAPSIAFSRIRQDGNSNSLSALAVLEIHPEGATA